MATLDELTSGTSGGFPDRVASLGNTTEANTDLVNQLMQLQQKQEQLRAAEQNVPNVGDHLKSLPGVLALLGGGVATAAGAPDLGSALVGGFAKGSMAAGEEQKAKLQEERKLTADLVEAQRQRLTTLLQSRPEMFLDPKTGESLIDPRLIGYASTGYMMPINPAVNYQLTKQSEAVDRQVSLGMSMIINGDTYEKRRQGAIILDKALGLNLQPDFYESLMGQDEVGAWNQIFSNSDLDLSHSLEARVYALTNNKSLDDPEVVSMLRRTPRGNGMGDLTSDKYAISLLAELNQGLSQAGEDIHNLPWEDQIDYFFKGNRSADAAFLKKFFMGTDAFGTGVSGSTIANLAYRNAELMAMIYKMPGNEKFFADQGITSEAQIWERSFNTIGGAVSNIKTAQEDAASQNFGLKIQYVAGKLVQNDATLTVGEATDQAIRVLNDIKAKAVTSDGKFDVKLFNELVNQYVGGNQ